MNKKIKLSFCAVVKDKFSNIKSLIDNVKDLADEIIIVDSGSEKKIVDYEKENADKVFQIPWNNDFAQLRNFAIKHSKGEWILALDSDETMTEQLKNKIKELIENPGKWEGFYFNRIHYIDEPHSLKDYWMHLRLYRRHAHYFGAVHESIKNLQFTKKIKCKDCFILHHNNRGYQRQKSLKYSRYLLDEIKEMESKNDLKMVEYYKYKLWVQDNLYLLETDKNPNKKLLNIRYKEYEKRKKIIEKKMRNEPKKT